MLNMDDEVQADFYEKIKTWKMTQMKERRETVVVELFNNWTTAKNEGHSFEMYALTLLADLANSAAIDQEISITLKDQDTLEKFLKDELGVDPEKISEITFG